jgi:hypothetical protein
MANENEVSISSEFPEGIPDYPTKHPNWSTKEVENPAPNESAQESAPVENEEEETTEVENQEPKSDPLGLNPQNLQPLAQAENRVEKSEPKSKK